MENRHTRVRTPGRIGLVLGRCGGPQIRHVGADIRRSVPWSFELGLDLPIQGRIHERIDVDVAVGGWFIRRIVAEQ